MGNNYDKELEQRILSTCEGKRSVFSDLTPEDFYYSSHQEIYRAFVDGNFDLTLEQNKAVYGYDVEDYFRAMESSASDEAHLVPNLIELSVRRKRKQELIKEIERVDDLSIRLPTVRNLGAQFLSGKKLAEVCREKWKNKKKINLGRFEHLNRDIYELSRKHVLLIAGRPGTGKTGFAWQLAQEIASQLGEKFIFFSGEMADEAMLSRMAKTKFYECNPEASVKESNQWFFYNVKYDENFAEEIVEEMCPNMEMLDIAGMTIPKIKAYIKTAKELWGERVGTILIDYVQLITGEGSETKDKQGWVAKQLQIIAKEFDVRIIALTQLNRTAEGERPRKDQIKESSVWEDVADEIWALYHHKDLPQAMCVEFLKSRHNGATGIGMLKKDGLYFDNPSDTELEIWRDIWRGGEK